MIDREVVTPKVSIIAHTLTPEMTVAKAGKLCYSKVGVEQIEEKLTDEEVDRFVNMLSRIGHESPLEHAVFTFAVEGISRACSHQIVRHRLASYSQQSQRYVNLKENFIYITPPEIEVFDEANKIYIESMMSSFEAYVKISSLLKDRYLSEGLFTGKNAERDAEKKAIEDARYVLPNACETKMVFTMNARTLLNFIKHRDCERAQWEIRELTRAMVTELRKISPKLFSRCGANCRYGKCGEGNMSCQSPLPKWEDEIQC